LGYVSHQVRYKKNVPYLNAFAVWLAVFPLSFVHVFALLTHVLAAPAEMHRNGKVSAYSENPPLADTTLQASHLTF